MEENRNERENIWSSHLVILFSHTFFCTVLIVEDLFLGWEHWVVPLIVIEVIVCWWLHLAQTFTPKRRLRIYILLGLMTFFFYGVHATSFYDLAAVMVVLLLVYMTTGEMELVYSGMAAYYLTVLYDLLFVPEFRFSISILSVTRLLLHLAIVALAGYLARMMIMHRKSTAADFMNRIAQLEETNRRTEDFLTNVSHELRTPINAVTGISAVMLKNEHDVRRKKDLRAIQEAGKRLFDQIGDILDHTEINTGRLQISEDNYMISSLVSDLYSEMHVVHGARDVVLMFDIATELPGILRGDGRKIKKIIRHLIENAVKFTKQGAAYVRISGIKKEYGINLLIQVSDTGIGIDEEEIERLTERFYQSDGGRSRSAGGLGLGLSVVQGLTNAMEGFMQIKSVRDEGTTVLVSIPQKIVDGAPCMRLDEPEGICVAFYDRPETYRIPGVWDFFNALISNLERGLHLSAYRATQLSELDGLLERVPLTHLFMGWVEYEKDIDYFENLGKQLQVVVLTEPGRSPRENSRIRLLRTPLSSFSVVNALNDKLPEGGMPGAGEYIDAFANRQMICPGVRVLVVDDEIMNLVVARGIFKDYQLAVETAGSGAEALEMCKSRSYDMVFLDHMMPEMDGVEVMKRMRKIDPKGTMKIVALTANAVSGAREMFFEEGFDEFLAKPLEYVELERVFRKLLPASSIRYIEAEEEQKQETVKAAEKEVKTQAEPPTEDGRLLRLKRIGLDTAGGMDYCMDDADFYLLLLEEFVAEAGAMADGLRTYSIQGEEESCHAVLSAVRSVAKMIGASVLEEAAAGADVAEVSGCMTGLAEDIAEALDDVEEEQDDISDDDLSRELAALGGFLNTYEADRALSLLETLLSYQNLESGLIARLQEVQQDVKNYDLRQAASKLNGLA